MRYSRGFLVALLFFLLPGAALAQNGRSLMISLASDHVDITTGFSGGQVTLFGVKDGEGDIAAVISGPERTMVVRQKSQVFGAWVNGESVAFTKVPSYYDFALSKPESELAPPELLQEKGVGLNSLTFTHLGREDDEVVEHFREALIRGRQTGGYYPLKPKNIVFLDGDFFRIDFQVPADVPTGNYVVRTFLFRGGAVADSREALMRIEQVGFGAKVNMFAHAYSLAYSLAAVMLAVAAGCGAHVLFRRG